jgi:hypothetical protein
MTKVGMLRVITVIGEGLVGGGGFQITGGMTVMVVFFFPAVGMTVMRTAVLEHEDAHEVNEES